MQPLAGLMQAQPQALPMTFVQDFGTLSSAIGKVRTSVNAELSDVCEKIAMMHSDLDRRLAAVEARSATPPSRPDRKRVRGEQVVLDVDLGGPAGPSSGAVEGSASYGVGPLPSGRASGGVGCSARRPVELPPEGGHRRVPGCCREAHLGAGGPLDCWSSWGRSAG